MTNNIWMGSSGDFALGSNWSLLTDAGDDEIDSGAATVGKSETIVGVTSLSIGVAGSLIVDGDLASGPIVNTGSLSVDDSLTISGTLENLGVLTLGPAHAGVAAKSLIETAAASLSMALAKTSRALLIIKSAAGFGTPGEVAGAVNLAGNSKLEFASGKISDIAAGASLDLIGKHAIVDDRGGPANGALSGLETSEGSLSLEDGASLRLGGSFTNRLSLNLDASADGAGKSVVGGSRLKVRGTLTNEADDWIYIGTSAQTANDKIVFRSLVNDGLVEINGASACKEILSGKFENDSSVYVESGHLKVAGKATAASGSSGVFYLGYDESAASLAFHRSVASSQEVEFANAFYHSSGAETLKLFNAPRFSADIVGFGLDDSVLHNEVIDIKDFGTGSKVAFADDVLTLTDQGRTASLTFTGATYSLSSFKITTNATHTLIKNA